MPFIGDPRIQAPVATQSDRDASVIALDREAAAASVAAGRRAVRIEFGDVSLVEPDGLFALLLRRVSA